MGGNIASPQFHYHEEVSMNSNTRMQNAKKAQRDKGQ